MGRNAMPRAMGRATGRGYRNTQPRPGRVWDTRNRHQNEPDYATRERHFGYNLPLDGEKEVSPPERDDRLTR